MASPVGAVDLISGLNSVETTRLDSKSGPDFANSLVDALTEIGEADKHADELAVRFADGDPDVGIHEAVIAAEQAAVKIRYAVTLKNKLLDAYRELMNTQI